MTKQSASSIASFFSQLHTLIKSAIPILEAIRIMQHNRGYPFLAQIEASLLSGQSLSASLHDYFPAQIIAMFSSAEQSGRMEQVLLELANYYCQKAETEKKIRQALAYPSVVIIMAVLSLVLMFLFVLPGFEAMFLDMNVPMPPIFCIIRSLPVAVLALIVAGVVVYFRIKGDKLARLCLHSGFLVKNELIQFFKNLGFLLESGIAMELALQFSINSIGNTALKKQLLYLEQQVVQGEQLSFCLDKINCIPKQAVHMVAVGETSGQLAEMLGNVAQMYEKERDSSIKTFTNLLEPALTIVVGLVVALVAACMFVPLQTVLSNLQ